MSDEKQEVKIPLGNGAMNSKILFRWYDETHTFLDAVAKVLGMDTSKLVRMCVYRSLRDVLGGFTPRRAALVQTVYSEMRADRPNLDRKTYDGVAIKSMEEFMEELFVEVAGDSPDPDQS